MACTFSRSCDAEHHFKNYLFTTYNFVNKNVCVDFVVENVNLDLQYTHITGIPKVELFCSSLDVSQFQKSVIRLFHICICTILHQNNICMVWL